MGDFIRGRGTRFRARKGPEKPVERRGRRRRAIGSGAGSFPFVLTLTGAGPVGHELASDPTDEPTAAAVERGDSGMELEDLMSELARLLSRRSSTPRRDALRIAHRRIRRYASERGLGESWCDAVLMHFLWEQHAGKAVA